MSFTKETVHRIWDNESKSRIEVGPSQNKPDFIEVRFVGKDNNARVSITMHMEQAALLIKALSDTCGLTLESDGVSQ